jgi:Ca-activated chloride channel homolog
MRYFPVVLIFVFGSFCADAQQVLRGKVVMPDGTPPPQHVLIERVCAGGTPVQEAVAGKQGEFFWRAPNATQGVGGTVLVRCYLRARLKDMLSDYLDLQDARLFANLQLPTMVLRRSSDRVEGPKLSPAAVKTWDAAVKAYRASEWANAERLAREVARAAPQFAAAWNAVGLAANEQKKFTEAREAFQKAAAADPATLAYKLRLARAEISLQLWADAAKTAEAVIQADDTHQLPEAELNLGIARYMLNDAEAARTHWERYLERTPSGTNADLIRLKLDEMRRGTTRPITTEEISGTEPEPEFTAGVEASVPGGRKALAAIAHMATVPAAGSFFLEYCRAISTQTSRMTQNAVPKYAQALTQYVVSVTELMDLGERKGMRVGFKLKLADEKTERVLGLLGWRISERGAQRIVEPGDRAIDGARQIIPRVLGIDELAMKQALESGGTFEFAVESETAEVTGGAAWNNELRVFPTLPGGIAEAFVRDPKLARTYAGLAAMPHELAAAMVKNLGLHALTLQHAALWLYGDTFRLGPNGVAATPGGPGVDATWAKLAGVSPSEAAKFFTALLTVDHGRLAAFYAAVARGDEAHQRFFTSSLAQAQRAYAWYRDSDELRDGVGNVPAGCQARVFRELPLEGRSGDVWSSDLEAELAIADLARKRGRAIDAESARLLTRNFAEWRTLWPYFETLPGLGSAEFQALERFNAEAASRARSLRESTMAQWHSAAALIVLGRKAGSLDDAAAARAFGALCRTGDGLQVVREAAGGASDLDEAVAGGLLRLTGERRAAFDAIRELQSAPRLSAAGDDRGMALAGAVYGAMLDPNGLLVNEDRGLLRKHVFAPGTALFAPASVAGAHFSGGFVAFEEVSRRLTSAGRLPPAPVAAKAAAADGPSDAPETLFRASGRLVEINATVTDEKGKLLDGLRAENFAVLDRGQAMPVTAFENGAAPLSCVLLLDTSQSMDAAIAALKAAAMRLIAGLRPGDSIAVYSLNGGISELQPFTTDKVAATRAVLSAELGELTALYDGLVRVNRDLIGRTGKKVIVVLTDGEDTASTLSAETAVLRAKTAGVPIYTVAQGHAVGNAALLKELRDMSQATGGKAFAIRTAAEIGPVFDGVLEDLLHGYLLAFVPAGGEDRSWRRIEVKLRRPGKVRAREGYYPE